MLYYWSLDPATKIKNGKTTYTIAQLNNLYKSNPTTAVNFAISATATALGLAGTAVSIGTAVLGFVLSEGISAAQSSNTKRAMQERLVSLCGVQQVVNAKNATGSWKCNNGLLATYWFTGIPTLLASPWEYKAVPTGTQLKGEKWYVGNWTF